MLASFLQALDCVAHEAELEVGGRWSGTQDAVRSLASYVHVGRWLCERGRTERELRANDGQTQASCNHHGFGVVGSTTPSIEEIETATKMRSVVNP